MIDIYVCGGNNVSVSITTSNYRYRDFPENRRVYIIAVPKYHENLFKHVQKNHDWLSKSIVDPGRMGNPDKNVIQHWTKKINSKEEFDKLERMIADLREEKSEIFIDQSYYAKPRGVSIKSYIIEFIKSKSIANHYTFSNYYRITVFPYGADVDNYPPKNGPKDDKGNLIDERQEYLIVPLLIRLKHGKTYEQSKTLSYTQNSDGSWDYKINDVNRSHFKRDPDPKSEEDDEEENGRKEAWIQTRNGWDIK